MRLAVTDGPLALPRQVELQAPAAGVAPRPTRDSYPPRLAEPPGVPPSRADSRIASVQELYPGTSSTHPPGLQVGA
eukprot:2618045-Rhodomonas_salina.2